MSYMAKIFEEELDRLIKMSKDEKSLERLVDKDINKYIKDFRKVIYILKDRPCKLVTIKWDKYSREMKRFGCCILVCLREEKERIQYMLDKGLFPKHENEFRSDIDRFNKALQYWGNPLEGEK